MHPDDGGHFAADAARTQALEDGVCRGAAKIEPPGHRGAVLASASELVEYPCPTQVGLFWLVVFLHTGRIAPKITQVNKKYATELKKNFCAYIFFKNCAPAHTCRNSVDNSVAPELSTELSTEFTVNSVDKDAFFARLAEAIQSQPSNRELASKCEISEGTVRRYLRGETYPPLDTLRDIAEATGYHLSWIADGTGPKRIDEHEIVTFSEDGPDPSEYTYIPRYNVAASCGGGAIVDAEAIQEHLAFRTGWVSSMGPKDHLALIAITGDSMAPSLQDGDVVMLNMNDRDIKDGSVYAIQLDGTLLVKRLRRRLDGSILVISDNPSIADEILPPGAPAPNIIGRIIWACGRM